MVRSEQEWIALFQRFHRHPELGGEEIETTKMICDVLQEQGIELVPSALKTGTIAVIRGAHPGRTVCLRADIDALPVTELTQLPYGSEHPGRMHACGHDYHITAALYAASLLQEQRERLCGTVYLVFQPAEELMLGGKEAVATGLLRGAEEFYGFHAEPSLRAGQVSVREGSVMAACDRFAVSVTGRGCHGAAPQLGNNPIPVLASIVHEIQSYAARGTSPLLPKVVSVTHVSAGETWNVIPDRAFLEGTARSMDAQERERIHQNVVQIARAYEELAGVQTEVDWQFGPAAVINDAALCGAARRVCAAAGLECVSLPPAMLGDDFSEYGLSVEGSRSLYLKFGVGAGPSLHSPRFCVDPAAIRPTAECLAALLAKRTADAGSGPETLQQL